MGKYEVTRANGTTLTVDATDEAQARRLGSDGGHGILGIVALDEPEGEQAPFTPEEGYHNPAGGEPGSGFFQQSDASVEQTSPDVVETLHEFGNSGQEESDANPG